MTREESEATQARCASDARSIRRGDEWLRWDLATETFAHLAGAEVTDAWMTADGSHVLGIDAGGGLVWWDADGHRIDCAGLHLATRPEASDDGRVVAIAGNPTIVVDVATGEQRAIEGAATSVTTAHGGRLIAIAHAGDVMVFDAASGELLRQLTRSNGMATIAMSPDASWLLAAGADLSSSGTSSKARGCATSEAMNPRSSRRLRRRRPPAHCRARRDLARLVPARGVDVERLPDVRDDWLSNGGRWLLTDGGDGVHRIDRDDGPVESATIPGGTSIRRAVVTDDGDALMSSEGVIRRWRRGGALESLGTTTRLPSLRSRSTASPCPGTARPW